MTTYTAEKVSSNSPVQSSGVKRWGWAFGSLGFSGLIFTVAIFLFGLVWVGWFCKLVALNSI